MIYRGKPALCAAALFISGTLLTGCGIMPGSGGNSTGVSAASVDQADMVRQIDGDTPDTPLGISPESIGSSPASGRSPLDMSDPTAQEAARFALGTVKELRGQPWLFKTRTADSDRSYMAQFESKFLPETWAQLQSNFDKGEIFLMSGGNAIGLSENASAAPSNDALSFIDTSKPAYLSYAATADTFVDAGMHLYSFDIHETGDYPTLPAERQMKETVNVSTTVTVTQKNGAWAIAGLEDQYGGMSKFYNKK